MLKKEGIRAELDDSNEKLGYRLRNAVVNKIPYTLVIGDKEKESGSVTYRVYGQQEQISVKAEEFLALIKERIESKSRF